MANGVVDQGDEDDDDDDGEVAGEGRDAVEGEVRDEKAGLLPGGRRRIAKDA